MASKLLAAVLSIFVLFYWLLLNLPMLAAFLVGVLVGIVALIIFFFILMAASAVLLDRAKS